jgi:hypothetical protein
MLHLFLGVWRHVVLGFGGVYCHIPACLMVQSSSGTGSADGAMDFAVRDELPWIPARGEPTSPLPRRRFLRRTPGNAAILARTVSVPLGWRRRKTQKKSRRSGPRVGLTGIRSSSTNCSSRHRCMPDWPNSAAMNSGSSTNSRSHGSSGTCAV